jgi:hypothetical protein
MEESARLSPSPWEPLRVVKIGTVGELFRGNDFGGEPNHTLVHRLKRIGDDIANGVTERLDVEFQFRKITGEKIFRPHHGAAQDAGDGILQGRFQ